MQGPEKDSYKDFDNENKFLRLKNSPLPPPHNFSNGPSITATILYGFRAHAKAIRYNVNIALINLLQVYKQQK